MCELDLKSNLYLKMRLHPGKKIQEELKDRGWTQRQFAFLLWKKVSEVNELIKWKRNITVQRDILLSHVLWTSRKYRLDLQNEYEYYLVESDFDKSKLPNLDQKIHTFSEQINQAEIPAEKISSKLATWNHKSASVGSSQWSKTLKNDDKSAWDQVNNLDKIHQTTKDDYVSTQQKNHHKFDQQKIAEDSKNLQKIEKKHSLPKQDFPQLDSGRKIITPEWQVKKDKYEIQKIYNHNDKFDSYFTSKEKKSETQKQDWSKLNSIQNTVSSKLQKSTKEKIHNPKDHLKNKEHIFRNF